MTALDIELQIRANEIQCQRMQNNAWRGKGNNPLLAERVKKKKQTQPPCWRYSG